MNIIRNKPAVPFPVTDCRFSDVLYPLKTHGDDDEAMFFRAKDCGISHMFYGGVNDGAWYILGQKDGRWVFAYGDAGEDEEWVCCFESFPEVGEPYRPWFQQALVDFALRSPAPTSRYYH
ncbi:hypothetical protein [Burkholderia gladioli]|uniref:hypothetical protein n=1 Tax=Burkholderia gladioli TaxID=28095 RepID=UPI0016407A09|nr:hypothetical protein [Burkholderia gladioli]